jgi:hypothetical protein
MGKEGGIEMSRESRARVKPGTNAKNAIDTRMKMYR